MKLFACHCLAVASALAAPAAAQQIPAPPSAIDAAGLPRPLLPIHTGPAEGATPYGIWAAGDDYKVSFHDGATFVPYLGKDYPRTQSLRWRTTSVLVGERELRTKEPRLSHTALRAEYDLGGVVEAYDVRHEGLEQTFVLKSRPASSGDLLIRGTIDTDLRAAAGADGIDFADAAGRRILRYGAAVAIDAQGRRQPLQTLVDDDVITLRLDATWLATAQFPLVVDPLLSVFVSDGGVSIAGFDLVREPALNGGNLWLAVSRYAGAPDADLWLTRYDDDGSNPVINFTDLSASWSSFEPSQGIHFTAGKTLLAFTREMFTGTRRIRYHLHSRNDNLLQTHVLNLGDLATNAWRPAVAHDLHPIGPNSLVVVYQREGTGAWAELPDSSIYGCEVVLTGNGTASPEFAIASAPALDHERPAIGKVQLGAAQVWTVAWQVIDSGLVAGGGHPDWDVACRRVDRHGNVSTAQYSTQANDGFHQMAPRLAGYNSLHVVTWTTASVALLGNRPSTVIGATIQARRLEWNGAAFRTPYPTDLVQYNLDPRLELTGFDADRHTGSHYLLTFRSTVTDTVYARELGYRGHLLQSATVYNPAANEHTGFGAVAFDERSDAFVIAYSRAVPLGSSDVRLVRFAQPTAPLPATFGLACGSAQLHWQGSQILGSEHSAITVDGAPPGGLLAVAVALAPFSTPLLGIPGVHNGCWLLVPNTGPTFLGFLPLAIGPSASFELPLPEWLDPLTLHFQAFHFDAGNTELFTTSRLQVPLVK